MLPLEEFRKQLKQLYKSLVFQENSNYITQFYDEDNLTIRLRTNPWIHKHTNADIVILRIEYDQIYNEPTLYIQLMNEQYLDDSPDILTNKICLVPDMSVILPEIQKDCFVIEPEQLNGSIWWCFHQCNTEDIIGNNPLYKDKYLERWKSTFIDSWI